MIRAVVIDDEPACRELLSIMIRRLFPEIEIVGTACNVSSAVEVIKNENPNLVFLDINLGDGNGFQVLAEFKNLKAALIFITAYDEFAVRAIQFSAIDYILKPINEAEFSAGVSRAIKRIGQDQSTEVGTFVDNMTRRTSKDRKIVLRTADSIYVVGIDTIIRCESDYSYTTFYLSTGEKILISKRLKEIEELLNGLGFVRIHQSHLVNLNFVERFKKKDGGILVMTDGSIVPVSPNRRQTLIDDFAELQRK